MYIHTNFPLDTMAIFTGCASRRSQWMSMGVFVSETSEM